MGALYTCSDSFFHIIKHAFRLSPCLLAQLSSYLLLCQVCGKCALRDSCKFVNQSMWNSNAKTLQLHHVMRTITLYGLESVPTELAVPEDIKKSVSRLLKEVVKLSKVC